MITLENKFLGEIKVTPEQAQRMLIEQSKFRKLNDDQMWHIKGPWKFENGILTKDDKRAGKAEDSKA